MPASLALLSAAVVLVAATHADDPRAADAPSAPDLAAAVTAASTTVAPPVETAPAPTAVTFAEVDATELALPADEVVAHGFHEAGGSGPQPLTPVGRHLPAEGAATIDAAATVVDAEGPEYLVLPTRNRGTASTGAVDVVLEEGEDVLAPVDGVVTAVADYALYGKHEDTLVHIRPDATPHLEVKVLHVDGVTVAEGDTVAAGETVIADTARRIPVRNQIDRFVGRALPHVHLEVVSSTAGA